jgi:hypothetical protein
VQDGPSSTAGAVPSAPAAVPAVVAQGPRPHTTSSVTVTGGSSGGQAGAGATTAATSSTTAVVVAGAAGVFVQGSHDSSCQPAQVDSSSRKGGSSSSRQRPKGARECVVCWEEEPCVLLLPCRHLCCCEGCSQALQAAGKKECPMCRAAVEQHIPVFF